MKPSPALVGLLCLALFGCDSKPQSKTPFDIEVRVYSGKEQAGGPIINGDDQIRGFQNFTVSQFICYERLRQLEKLQESIYAAESEIDTEKRRSFTDSTRREVEANAEAKVTRLRQEISQNRALIVAILSDLEKSPK
jgi:hypothetical protein